MAFQSDAFGKMANGLDRAPLNAYTTIKSDSPNGHPQEKPKNIPDGVASAKNGSHHNPMASIRRLSTSLRSKIHRRSHNHTEISTDQRGADQTILAPTLAPTPPVTTKEDRFGEAPPEKPSLPPLKDFVTKPVETVKAVIHIQGGGDLAETLAKKDVTHGAGVQLVRAYEDIGDAGDESNEDDGPKMQKLELLKKIRQDSYVRWTLDRHVGKVGRIQAHRVPWKEKQEFLETDENGKQQTKWMDYGRHLFFFYLEKYGGHYIGSSSELPEPTEAALISSFERVLLTSTPVQNVYMTLRRISHWENPWESGTCMVIYFFLLIYSYITRAFLLYALYTVLKRRYYPPTIEELRVNLEQAEDREEDAQDLSQLIDQHGAQGWVDPLIEKAGPTALAHFEELANFMEILRNFYEWRDPLRTAVTLGWLCFLWVMITLTPVSLLVKESFFALGFMFFGLAPISARYPQYRLLLSPIIWTFWRIPTHAEWAVARLQAEATQQLAIMREDDTPTATANPTAAPADQPSPNEMEETRTPPVRIGRYHCISEKRHGNLCVSTEKVSFEMHLTSKERWSVEYENLKSMEKIVGSSTISSGDDLLLVDMQGIEYRASGLKVRDEVFSQIIGYSSVNWQRMA